MTRRPLRGRDGGGSPSQIIGTSPLESLDECPSEGSLPEPPSSQDPMELLEKDPGFVFFEFKEVECGILRFGALLVASKWLRTISQICIGFQAKGTDRGGSDTLEEYYSLVHLMLDGKVWIGHDIHKFQIPRLLEEIKLIGQKPPIPRKVIDTLPFIKSKTKLAQLALLFDFGEERYNCLEACHVNLTAIMKCRAAMSILDMDKAVPGYYPIICHIIKCDDESKSGIEEEEEEKSPLKAIAECASEVLPEGSSSHQYPMKMDPGVVFFHFQKDRFGMLIFGAVEVCSKTLKFSKHVGFCIPPIDKRVSWLSALAHKPKIKEKVEEHYDKAYDILHGKMLIGHDIRKSDWPRLLKEVNHIGRLPPTPKQIIDTAPFIRSKTKLAKLALLLGLGKPFPRILAPLEYIGPIINCGAAMSILDMEEEQDEFHPMISHLMKFKLPEIRKSERLMYKEADKFKP